MPHSNKAEILTSIMYSNGSRSSAFVDSWYITVRAILLSVLEYVVVQGGREEVVEYMKLAAFWLHCLCTDTVCAMMERFVRGFAAIVAASYCSDETMEDLVSCSLER